MTSADGFSDNFAKLSPEDQERFRRDLFWYGTALIKVRDDGGVAYLPPETWCKEKIEITRGVKRRAKP